MRKLKILLKWTSDSIVGVLFLIVLFLPTEMYMAIWWFIPKSLWSVVGTTLGAIIWIFLQGAWALCVGVMWYVRLPTSDE